MHRLERLRKLAIGGSPGGRLHILLAIGRLPTVEELRLTDLMLSEEEIKGLAGFPKLRTLVIQGTIMIGDDDVAELSKLKSLETSLFHRLDVSGGLGNYRPLTTRSLEYLREMANLRVVELPEGCGLDSDTITDFEEEIAGRSGVRDRETREIRE
ncbi:MAG: hypothetical protein GXX96_32620 [Planctomycetaceae bacterium]|nr:hypothetical protein [Planctomycetaceae bacterium]